jgi:hypothetical protein
MADKPRNRQSGGQTPPGQPLPVWLQINLVPSEHALSALRDWGRVILASDDISDADRGAVEQAVQQLSALLGQPLDPTSSQIAAAAAQAAFVIGAHGGMTDTARTFFERSRTMQMRVQKATSSKEQELRAAVKAEIEALGGTIPSKRPHKDAEAIRDKVNARLAERGIKPASADAIARRLKPQSKPHS